MHQFLGRAAKTGVGGLTALALLAMERPKHARAQNVEFNGPKLLPEHIADPTPSGYGVLRGYYGRPASAGEAITKARTAALASPRTIAWFNIYET